MNSKPEKLLYSIKDAAYALSVSRATIYNEINAGRLKYVQFKQRKFISRQALDEWVRDRELERAGVQIIDTRINNVGSHNLNQEANRGCA